MTNEHEQTRLNRHPTAAVCGQGDVREMARYKKRRDLRA